VSEGKGIDEDIAKFLFYLLQSLFIGLELINLFWIFPLENLQQLRGFKGK
jgi:hypothetical protein